ncbi:hypothetical protein H1C71_023859 [Ictidomys tridecemlineatus]|nr:hypothetical protein H1C71_023859 [Ictidomys tridecemlineatus]KAG3271062.1 hypothetical protein H1C71_023859 [Ictidomys tridecemlineatus]KAG3271063.1 hypothetical protein H1C71_023859 [Ictidomys tridecemlineatus]KAG3271064.1 hypothetical protein H1C71_023859 [Ictidomys tridecemlineatus]KAG3271065.1 hypothetical protein H1C71_023859 [Ictidomys tridecemlineatus]
MCFFFPPYIFFQVTVNSLNSQNFYWCLLQGNTGDTLSRQWLPGRSQKGQWQMDLDACSQGLNGLVEHLTPCAGFYASGDNGVPGAWGKTEYDPRAACWAGHQEGQGLVLPAGRDPGASLFWLLFAIRV